MGLGRQKPLPQVAWERLNRQIASCRACPRLREHCETVAREKRRMFADEEYWGRPVPNFGDPQARLLIVGLAPAAHGANRTGRMFTGDRSGDWLYRALHKAGFASQSEATSLDDGLTLRDCAITATCHCAPPQNKPTREEIENCRDFMTQSVEVLPVKVFLALGSIGWRAVIDYAKSVGWWTQKLPKFGHGETLQLENGLWLVGSFHPSQQNTFTGKLTEPMFDAVFRQVHDLLESPV
ncbi:MAG: uracil-DNA glycosylase [Planctomycetaceae bacterium]|nr:uracil-DNA glycosylase [Planctomycetaceae bacterium]